MVVVISHPNTINFELETLLKLFENGLEYFHLRKETWLQKECEAFLEKIPKNYHSRIRLHQFPDLLQRFPEVKIHLKSNQNWMENAVSKSFHKIEDIESSDIIWNYCFLSPIFDSISKENYPASFQLSTLKTQLKPCKQKVLALGGISPNNAQKAMDLGFNGVAVLGSIWQEETIEKRIAAYQKICLSIG